MLQWFGVTQHNFFHKISEKVPNEDNPIISLEKTKEVLQEKE